MPRKGGTTRKQLISGRRLARRARGRGAVFSIEMMMFITILIPVMFALTEFSLLWSARHTLQAAAFEGARAASLPVTPDTAELRCMAAKDAADAVFANERFLHEDDGYKFELCDVGSPAEPMVHVKLKLPMTTASPDLLGIIGISIEDKFLTAEAVTRRQ